MIKRTTAAVFIVDDHPLVRAGFNHLVANEPDLEMCGEADGQSQALRQMRHRPVDVVLAAISLKNGTGLELTRELAAMSPDVRVLIYSKHDDSLYAERALRAGAKGYVNKREPAPVLLTAIRRVLNGQFYLSDQMTERMLCRTIGNGNGNGNPADESPLETLSDRELEVFELIGEGVTTRQIADRLFLSPKTVETYRENIKAKLNLKNAMELMQHAVKWTLENE